MSGFPGSFDEQILYRKPLTHSALRKATSGTVSRDRTFRIMAETSLEFVLLSVRFSPFLCGFEMLSIAVQRSSSFWKRLSAYVYLLIIIYHMSQSNKSIKSMMHLCESGNKKVPPISSSNPLRVAQGGGHRRRWRLWGSRASPFRPRRCRQCRGAPTGRPSRIFRGTSPPARPAAADVLHVGDVALYLLAVFVVQRQPPDLFRRDARRVLYLPHELVVVSHEAGVDVAERDDARARERRQVDDRRGLVAGGVCERVGENEAALGVGVQDLDGDPRHRAQYVAGLVRAAAGQVLGCGDDADDVYRKPEHRGRADGAEYRRAARHVGLHFVHPLRGFYRNAAAVERDRLAYQSERFSLAAALVLEHDQPRRLVAALGDAEECAHFEFSYAVGRHDGAFEPVPARKCPGAVGKRRRGERSRGLAHEVARVSGGHCDPGADVRAPLQREPPAGVFLGQDKRFQLLRLLLLRLLAGLVFIEPV